MSWMNEMNIRPELYLLLRTIHTYIHTLLFNYYVHVPMYVCISFQNACVVLIVHTCTYNTHFTFNFDTTNPIRSELEKRRVALVSYVCIVQVHIVLYCNSVFMYVLSNVCTYIWAVELNQNGASFCVPPSLMDGVWGGGFKETLLLYV